MTHELNLTQGAAMLCRSILTTPGRYTKADEIWHAGLIATGEALDSLVMPEDASLHDAWSKANGVHLTVSEKGREVIKAGIRDAITKGQIPASRFTIELMKAAGLSEDQSE